MEDQKRINSWQISRITLYFIWIFLKWRKRVWTTNKRRNWDQVGGPSKCKKQYLRFRQNRHVLIIFPLKIRHQVNIWHIWSTSEHQGFSHGLPLDRLHWQNFQVGLKLAHDTICKNRLYRVSFMGSGCLTGGSVLGTHKTHQEWQTPAKFPEMQSFWKAISTFNHKHHHFVLFRTSSHHEKCAKNAKNNTLCPAQCKISWSLSTRT